MSVVAYIDAEVDPQNGKILDVGGVRSDGPVYHGSMHGFSEFIEGVDYVCGHNVYHHDFKYLSLYIEQFGKMRDSIIDTLYWSPLLFPRKPYHALLKDDKLQTDELNNPLNDSKKAMELFSDEIDAFKKLDSNLKEIYFRLLSQRPEFGALFRYLQYSPGKTVNDKGIISRLFMLKSSGKETAAMIRSRFSGVICENADLERIIATEPVSLSYALAVIDTIGKDRESRSITPAWVLKNFPAVEQIVFKLRSSPCLQGCPYCNIAMDIHAGLKRWFGFESFRHYNGNPLQEKAVQAAIDNKSLLAVFPTGGGKSLTFQLPALMSGENMAGLTIVISPLQSLMKDQVDNLEGKSITEAVTINGLLDPIERAKSFERVENGSASILYISPESLRSISIEKMVLKRNIVRFVIDEAHCLSSWGQDFRVDYLYIADFIKSIQEKKNLTSIPVSCFTATAKPQVIEDIRNYFKRRLSVDLQLFTASVSRPNLHYTVLPEKNDEEKYFALRRLLEESDCPAIIYVSRTKKAEDISERLRKDGFSAMAYHGKMAAEKKIVNQNAFMSGEVRIVVATSAFGMGVDKSDVGLVIHYEISDSLENYVQEAGRAGRNENIKAECFVLFNDEDLSKHFILLNQTKVTMKEIQQVWKAIKDLTKFRSRMSNSALEIARQAGWDDGVADIETRVKTAISSLEQAGYLKRGQNMPRIYATGILAKTAQEAIDKIEQSPRFAEGNIKIQAERIIKNLIASRSRKGFSDEAESRVDYISDRLGIPRHEIVHIINLLREEKILADTKDVVAYFPADGNVRKLLAILNLFADAETFLTGSLKEQETVWIDYKKLNQSAVSSDLKGVEAKNLKILLNIWAISGWIKKKSNPGSRNTVNVKPLMSVAHIREKIQERHKLAEFIVKYLCAHASDIYGNDSARGDGHVEFSILELKEAYDKSTTDSCFGISLKDVEDVLFYLSRIGVMKIEGGFMVIYNTMTIERLELDNKRRYRIEDYQRLGKFYENRVQQIHIVGEYARKMIDDYKDALQFVEDYFQMSYPFFLNKYFRGRQKEISVNMTPAKFKRIFGEMSPAQLKVINDKAAKYIVVAAGPGSGKTRVLVHKLASLMMMEDVKHEQLLMLTFSRAAASEFKSRLYELIGNAAAFVEIKTFHSYCFDLLGQMGSVDKSDGIVRIAVDKIKTGDVDISRITKTVLVIDEAQDMDADEFALVEVLMASNEDMRVIAVGDDDQNIYEFRGSSPEYMRKILDMEGAVKYELLENFRSRRNLVEFTDMFVRTIGTRMKQHPIVPKREELGKVKITEYSSENMQVPLVRSIISMKLSGNVAVLTKTNEEALTVAGLLRKNGLPVRLMQTNNDFSLLKLDELHYFMTEVHFYDENSVFDDDEWNSAKSRMFERYSRSDKLSFCENLLSSFESEYRNVKYKTDFLSFLEESRLEDFCAQDSSEIIVSTIHKVKGKEFDNVFLMLDRIYLSNDEIRRQLYVAMTRAKENLYIHLNTSFLNGFRVDGFELEYDNNQYGKPEEVILATSLKDVWLNDFIYRQAALSNLVGGDRLVVIDGVIYDLNRTEIVKFSKTFQNTISQLSQNGYLLSGAEVGYIVWWKGKELKKEIRVLLPVLHFSVS